MLFGQSIKYSLWDERLEWNTGKRGMSATDHQLVTSTKISGHENKNTHNSWRHSGRQLSKNKSVGTATEALRIAKFCMATGKDILRTRTCHHLDGRKDRLFSRLVEEVNFHGVRSVMNEYWSGSEMRGKERWN